LKFPQVLKRVNDHYANVAGLSELALLEWPRRLAQVVAANLRTAANANRLVPRMQLRHLRRGDSSTRFREKMRRQFLAGIFSAYLE